MRNTVENIPFGAIDPLRFHRHFDDLEEFLATTQTWDLEFSVLDRHGFQAELFQYVDAAAGFQFGHARFHSSLRQMGSSPQGTRTFAIPAGASMHHIWRRQRVSEHDLLIFPEGGEFDSQSTRAFDMFVVSLRETSLQHAAKDIGCDARLAASLSREVDFGMSGALADLQRTCRECESQLMGPLHTSTETVPERLLAEELVKALCSAQHGAPASTSRRLQAVRDAQNYLVDHARQMTSVGSLCGILGVSRRTLESGFRECIGVSPKAYLQALRLNGVRNDLRKRAPNKIRVADVANTWGFWHLGQFAQDYRRHFQELPSETLGKQLS